MEAQRLATCHLELYKMYISLSELQDVANRIECDLLRATVARDHPWKIDTLKRKEAFLAKRIVKVKETISEKLKIVMTVD